MRKIIKGKAKKFCEIKKILEKKRRIWLVCWGTNKDITQFFLNLWRGVGGGGDFGGGLD